MVRKLSAGIVTLFLAVSLVWARCAKCPVLPAPAQPASSEHDCCDPQKSHDCGQPAPKRTQHCPSDRSLPDIVKADSAPALDTPVVDGIAEAAAPAILPEPALPVADVAVQLHGPPDLFLLNSVLLV